MKLKNGEGPQNCLYDGGERGPGTETLYHWSVLLCTAGQRQNICFKKTAPEIKHGSFSEQAAPERALRFLK